MEMNLYTKLNSQLTVIYLVECKASLPFAINLKNLSVSVNNPPKSMSSHLFDL